MEIEKKLKELEEKIDFLMFRQDLLFYNSAVNRVLYEFGINKEQYNRIMDLMDNYREKIGNNEKVSHGKFEEEIYTIVPELKGNYHFVESLTRAFWEDSRWEEVFETLYGNLPKYKYLKK
jgi:hypothetical protein